MVPEMYGSFFSKGLDRLDRYTFFSQKQYLIEDSYWLSLDMWLNVPVNPFWNTATIILKRRSQAYQEGAAAKDSSLESPPCWKGSRDAQSIEEKRASAQTVIIVHCGPCCRHVGRIARRSIDRRKVRFEIDSNNRSLREFSFIELYCVFITVLSWTVHFFTILGHNGDLQWLFHFWGKWTDKNQNKLCMVTVLF